MESGKLVIDDIEVKRLKANPWNTNIVTPENEAKIEASLKRFGMFRPLLVRTLSDGTLQLLAGEHRWQVAKRLGYTTVPVVNLGTLDDKTAKEIGLVDNGRYGEDDTLQLAELLKEIGGDDILTFLPYTDGELESIFAASSIGLDELDIPDDDDKLPELPSSKTTQTHQVMRFKVPVEDADYVQRMIESTMKNQGYMDDDSMTNAGNALVHICRNQS